MPRRGIAGRERKMYSLLSVFLPIALAFLLFQNPLSYAKSETIRVSPSTSKTISIRPGEELTYRVTWSDFITAGAATTRIDQTKTPDGKNVLVFSLTGRSLGLVERIYKVGISARSVYDPDSMQSLTYSLNQEYGRKKRSRSLSFEPEHNMVESRLNIDLPERFAVPEGVKDILSTLYAIRMLDSFSVDRVSFLNTHDSGKNWSVEIETLGREKIITPAGEFATVKVRTNPRYQGEFLNRGEVFLWLTDDHRRIPVQVTTRLKVGSFVFTLTGMKTGENEQ